MSAARLRASAPLVLAFADYRAPAERLARAARAPFAALELHHFPDGESRVRVPIGPGERLPERVAIVRSLDDPNAKLVEVLLAASAARDAGARELTLVAPYLGYMRQDTAFRPGEAVSQRVVGELLARAFDRLVTVDPHLHRTRDLGAVVPGCEAVALSAAGPLADFLAACRPGALLLGPDEESRQWVAAIGERAGLEHAVAAKHRRGDRDVEVELPELGGALRGRHVVLVDDVVSTGHSLAEAARALAAQGAASVAACVTHGLFAPGAHAALSGAGVTPVWWTDSIVRGSEPSGEIELASLLAEAL